jgi:molybdate transport system substrate-binding protein
MRSVNTLLPLRRRGLLLALLTLTVALPLEAADAPREPLLVFAAASLSDVLQEIGATYTRETGQPVKFSFAASSALAHQIESGAQADAFVSADTDWMDYLQSRKLIDPATRVNVVGNRLVLVAPADSKLTVKIAPGFGLRAALGTDGRLVTGDPDSVPVGRYAHAALSSLGVWDSIADRLVRADNVRSALAFVARGECPLGIVYRTDALIEPKVRIVDTFPTSSHAPILYPAAATARAGAAARQFVASLTSRPAESTFHKYGFEPAH